MPSLKSQALPSFRRPLWLSRLYAYVGADLCHRFGNEQDFQRTAMATASIAWIFAFHQLVSSRASGAAQLPCAPSCAIS